MAEQLYIEEEKVRDSHDGGYGKISSDVVSKFRQITILVQRFMIIIKTIHPHL
jgi:hypothetical protein